MMGKKDGRAWTPSVCAMLVLALGLAAWMHRQPLLDVLAMGLRDEENSHIFLVPFIECYRIARSSYPSREGMHRLDGLRSDTRRRREAGRRIHAPRTHEAALHQGMGPPRTSLEHRHRSAMQ